MEKVKTTGVSYAIPPLSNARGLANTRVLISWSGGKDSCLALYEIQKAQLRVAALLTTVTRDYDRISMHGVRRELLEKQADKLGLPLYQVLISKDATNEEYEVKMAEAFSEYSERGIDSVVFGDLFLEDIKAYREQFLARHQMRGLFPVWKRDTSSFIKEFIELGFKAVVTCVNSKVLDHLLPGESLMKLFFHRFPSTLIRVARTESFIPLCLMDRISRRR